MSTTPDLPETPNLPGSSGSAESISAAPLMAEPPTSTPAATPREPLIDRVAESLQGGIKTLIGSRGNGPRLFKSLLNGTWLGHPLHSVVTDIPITAWLLTAVFDVLWLLAPSANLWAARASQATTLVGVLGAFGAIATGATDWSDTYAHERRVGFWHGTLNTLATVLYLVSLGLRFGVFGGALDFAPAAGENAMAAILGFVGLGLVLVAAFLGGDLVFGNATGVNHTHFEPVVADFERVAALEEIPENGMRRFVSAEGAPVLLIRMGSNVYGIGSTCSHDGGPLHEGTLRKNVVQCPWHGARFNVKSGRVLTGPATSNVPRYDVRIRDGQIEVKRH
jgi:nitrite reductase/ring-hydroxylating ferredoxin subunit